MSDHSVRSLYGRSTKKDFAQTLMTVASKEKENVHGRTLTHGSLPICSCRIKPEGSQCPTWQYLVAPNNIADTIKMAPENA